MPKNQVLFECNMQMNEHDVRNYLQQIYDVPVHHVRLTLNKGEARIHGSANTNYGRHPDFKLAYVTLADGETFEYPQIIDSKDDEVTSAIKEQETVQKYYNYQKQQNWKKKFGGPNWFA